MNETQFNAGLRAVLRAQGLGALHVREADQPGTADLLIWKGQRLLAWVELKIGDHEVEPQQWQFLEEQVKRGSSAYVVRLKQEPKYPHAVTVARVEGHDHKSVVVGGHVDFHRVHWASQYFIAE